MSGAQPPLLPTTRNFREEGRSSERRHPAPRGVTFTLVDCTLRLNWTPTEAGEGAGPPNVGSGPTDPSERAEATLNVRMPRPKEASAGLGSTPRPNVNGPWA